MIIGVSIMEYEVVEGKDKGDVMLYALSTCVWCRKTKRLLSEIGVKYRYIFIDRLDPEEKDKVVAEMEKWNPRCSFPTLVINKEKCIVGFKDAEIKEELGDG